MLDEVPDVSKLHPWGRDLLKTSLRGSCFTGIVDSETGITYLHPVAPDRSGKYSFSCSEMTFPDESLLPDPPQLTPAYDTTPIVHNSDGNRNSHHHGPSHVQLSARVRRPYMTLNELSDWVERHNIGFFIKKTADNLFEIDLQSRSLYRSKFNYNGIPGGRAETVGGAGCGRVVSYSVEWGVSALMADPDSPRCWPAQDWACHVLDALNSETEMWEGLGTDDLTGLNCVL